MSGDPVTADALVGDDLSFPPEVAGGYLSGVHAPVARETTTGPLPVEGELPRELRGMFARNSGNPFHAPIGRPHWFDGHGMVHGLSFEDGRATYRSRWTDTPGLRAERAAGRALVAGIHDATGPVVDTANTDLTAWDGRLVATWWLTGQPMALDRSLHTVGPATAGRAGPVLPRMAAHPKVDPRTNELVFMGYDPFRPKITVGVARPDGAVHVAPLALPHAHIPHDLGITEHYTVVLDLPLGWDVRPDGRRRIAFFRDRPARFGVMPRSGDAASIRWFEDDPFYLYHLVGCWEQRSNLGGREIVVVGCRIADPIPRTPSTDPGVARLDTIELVPHLCRWRLHLDGGSVRRELLDDLPTEFPRVDDRRWGTAPRHSYHPRVAKAAALTFDAVVKYDLETGDRLVHEWPAGLTSGEVVFAPRAGGTDDDDGWLVTLLSDGARSVGVVLDARTLARVATVPMPVRVPQGFHAEWWPGGES